MTVRLWVGGEDYGLMSEQAAEMYLAVHRERYPDEPAYHEPASEDAPVVVLRINIPMLTFTLDDVEDAQARAAIAVHLTECPVGKAAHEEATYEEQCTPTSTFEYAFTPTGIGDTAKLRCLLCRWEIVLFNAAIEP